jgi:hypothetical protein
MPFLATQWLNHYLQPTMTVFEYGSGASTIFMAQRARHLVTVEHDRQWHANVSEALARLHIMNCAYHFRPPSPECVLQEDPSEQENPGVSFDAYTGLIDMYPDRCFDLVVVDGRARAVCITRALSKLKAGGYLLLDNSNHDKVSACLPLMQAYERTDLHGLVPGWPPGGWTTSVWRIA